jgi:hypothetical protein
MTPRVAANGIQADQPGVSLPEFAATATGGHIMDIALLIAGLVVAFVLLDALLIAYVLRRKARRRAGLTFSFDLGIEPAEQTSNVRRIPEQGVPRESTREPSVPISAKAAANAAPNANADAADANGAAAAAPADAAVRTQADADRLPDVGAGANVRVIDLTGEESDLRWPASSVWTDATSLGAEPQSRPSAASKAE